MAVHSFLSFVNRLLPITRTLFCNHLHKLVKQATRYLSPTRKSNLMSSDSVLKSDAAVEIIKQLVERYTLCDEILRQPVYDKIFATASKAHKVIQITLRYCCECQILKDHFPHYVSKEFHLCHSDSKYKGSFFFLFSSELPCY